jgi:hypothetical protein
VRFSRARAVVCSLCLLVSLGGCAPATHEPSEEAGPEPVKTVKARVQVRPGGEEERVEMPVYEAPVDLPSVTAAAAALDAEELILGVVVEGAAVAYPIRYLAMFEIVNDRVQGVPLAPTW